VAGHRLGTMEIESALVAHARVAEAAVVSKHHEIKGESVFAYVVLNVSRPEGAAAKALIEELRQWVGDQLSPIAKPDEIRLTDNLPKTRSGKIMRRLLRSIARGEPITQDMSTLENPGILEQLRGAASPAPAKRAAQARPAVRAKPAPPAKRTASAKRAAAAKKRSAPKKRAAAPRRAAAPTRAGAAKRAKRKGLAAKSRRTAAKPVRRTPRRKK
jgi:AMP-binding enzyme C-terminal domain